MFRCLADDCTHPSLSWHGLALHMSHSHPEEVTDEEIGAYLIEHLAVQLDELDAPDHPDKQSVTGEIRPGPGTMVSYVGSWEECTERALEIRQDGSATVSTGMNLEPMQ
jgi:hypothetical protein